MSWLRIDDGFTSNGKIAQLTDREFRVWMRLLCHCARSHDPTVDRPAMNEVAGLSPQFIARIAALELVDKVGGTFEVHDWERYQPNDSTGADRQARWRSRRNALSNGRVTAGVTEEVTP